MIFICLAQQKNAKIRHRICHKWYVKVIIIKKKKEAEPNVVIRNARSKLHFLKQCVFNSKLKKSYYFPGNLSQYIYFFNFLMFIEVCDFFDKSKPESESVRLLFCRGN